MLMIFELLRRRSLRQRVVSCLLIAVAEAALLYRLQRDVAQYHVINNVGIVVEFLARMSGPGTKRNVLSVPTNVCSRWKSGRDADLPPLPFLTGTGHRSL